MVEVHCEGNKDENDRQNYGRGGEMSRLTQTIETHPGQHGHLGQKQKDANACGEEPGYLYVPGRKWWKQVTAAIEMVMCK